MASEALKDRIRRLRVFRGMTQEELARSVGLSLQAVNLIERGKRSPRDSTREALARALDVSETYLSHGFELNPDAARIIPPELSGLYAELDTPARSALMENARTLRELQAEYAALTEHEERRVAEDREDLEDVPDAAHPVTEEIREARKDAEDYEER